MLLVGNQWSEQPKNVRFVPNTKTLSEWYFWSGQSVKSVSYIQDSKGSLHCMEINSPFKGSMHFPSSVQQDGLFQVLQINTRFCFNCWSVINALARLSTLTSASRAAHLTWVEDRLSAHRAHNCSRRGRNHLYLTTSLPLTHNSLIILLSISSLFNKEEMPQMETPI